MASADQFVARVLSNSEKILRYAWILQLFAGLVLLGVAYLMGHSHFHLIREGMRAQGLIVAYKQQNFRRSSDSFSTTGYMPIVEFRAGDRFVQFQDWLGSSIAGRTNIPVIVLYDAANPTVAMIDRPAWNWLPWAPIFAIGIFLVLVAINGFFRSQRSAESS